MKKSQLRQIIKEELRKVLKKPIKELVNEASPKQYTNIEVLKPVNIRGTRVQPGNYKIKYENGRYILPGIGKFSHPELDKFDIEHYIKTKKIKVESVNEVKTFYESWEEVFNILDKKFPKYDQWKERKKAADYLNSILVHKPTTSISNQILYLWTRYREKKISKDSALKALLKAMSKYGSTMVPTLKESVNEATNWPREVEAYDKDVIFRREKIMGNKAKYQIINKKTNKVIEPKGRIYTTLNGLSYDAGDYILPKGGTQSSRF